MRMLNPPHPGDLIRTEIIDPTGLSVTAAAKVLGVSRLTLSRLLNSKAVRRHGTTNRKSFRGQDGHAYAHAGVLRNRSDAQAPKFY